MGRGRGRGQGQGRGRGRAGADGQGRAGQGRARQGRAGQQGAGQGAGQRRAGQGRAGQGTNPQPSRCFGCTNSSSSLTKARTGQSPLALTGQSATGRAPTWSTLAPHDEYLPPIRGGRAGKFQQLRLKTQPYLGPDKKLC